MSIKLEQDFGRAVQEEMVKLHQELRATLLMKCIVCLHV
jgi:hypothetical protein